MATGLFEFGELPLKNPGADPALFEQVMAALGVDAPVGYREFMCKFNGIEGFLKSGKYLILYPIEQLTSCNEPYGLRERGPGIVIFGSDGGSMAYAFDVRPESLGIVEVDSVTMELGPIRPCGRSFLEFAEFLSIDVPPPGQHS